MLYFIGFRNQLLVLLIRFLCEIVVFIYLFVHHYNTCQTDGFCSIVHWFSKPITRTVHSFYLRNSLVYLFVCLFTTMTHARRVIVYCSCIIFHWFYKPIARTVHSFCLLNSFVYLFVCSPLHHMQMCKSSCFCFIVR